MIFSVNSFTACCFILLELAAYFIVEAIALQYPRYWGTWEWIDFVILLSNAVMT